MAPACQRSWKGSHPGPQSACYDWCVELKAETLAAFLILLPGFVSSAVLDVIVTRKSKDPFSKIIEALVLSFVIYVTLIGAFRYPVIVIPHELQKLPGALGSNINVRFAVGALVLSLILPLVLGYLATSDVHMKILRYIGVTHKTSRDTTWLDVFIEQRRYVIVNLSGQRRIFGWPQYYSEEPGGLLYLADPAWVNEDGSYTNLDLHGIFLVEPGSIESIEFTNVDEVSAQPERGS
jgi:hypothetical protein